ncbi:MAG: glycine cleavage system aminomethyltransferase GcvT [Gemmatimonadetes bacterium]|nr:glycine cleavage system aminomethyltransferase GcvT [Gemmatimonadota bacterium]MYA42240.1 glycine cleavage system aminomethyltransferase GcvT [Gemmatimonadota bacterium]MYE94110.1 glycine cleavage system aminomethyltransferase GcvT [Gemmatimonadota bacterium]MYJ08957.1 glycine cleavage system aminomethyltransferase GcvT [Gemmatimonadota bacterium]
MNPKLRKTPLHDVHTALGGKLVPFAGYSMPVQYPSGIRAEHAAVRTAAGLFDVSHMGEFTVRGPQAEDFVQYLTVNDVSRVAVGQAQYSALCNERGTILDDLLVYRFADRFVLVVNASNRTKDWRWVNEHAVRFDVELADDSDDIALIALQGPASEAILSPLTDVDPGTVGYYRFAEGEVAGVEAVVSRTGYTGEDGFELYLPTAAAVDTWRALTESGEPHGLSPAGLGARDSLRLEMGYALYGNDLDEEHTALESGLGWIVKLDAGDFIGRDALAVQKERGVTRRLTGIRLTQRGFPRPGYPLVHDGEDVGTVTSGVASPSLGYGVALGYLPVAAARPGTEVGVRIRDRVIAGRTQRPPFYTEGSIKR